MTANYRNLALSASTGWKGGGLDLGHADKPFGAAGFYGNFNSWERTRTWYAGLRQRLDRRTEAAFSYRRHTDHFILYRDRPAVYANRHVAEGWQASLRRRETLSSTMSLSYGAEGFGETVSSTKPRRPWPAARGRLRRSGPARPAAVFILRRYTRRDYRGLPGQWSPSLAVGLWLSGTLKWRTSASRAFRVPTYTDLYYQDPANRGDPSLRPESAWSYDSGLEWRPTGRARLEATVFHRRERDGIDYVRFASSEPWRAANIHRLRFTGLEASARISVGNSVLDLGYTVLRARSDGDAWLLSKYVFSHPVHSFVLGWRASWGRHVALRTRIGGGVASRARSLRGVGCRSGPRLRTLAAVPAVDEPE